MSKTVATPLAISVALSGGVRGTCALWVTVARLMERNVRMITEQ